MGSVAAGHAGLGLRLAAEVAAGRRLAAHDDLRPRADQRVRRISVLQRRLEARAAVAAHAHGIVCASAARGSTASARRTLVVVVMVLVLVPADGRRLGRGLRAPRGWLFFTTFFPARRALAAPLFYFPGSIVGAPRSRSVFGRFPRNNTRKDKLTRAACARALLH